MCVPPSGTRMRHEHGHMIALGMAVGMLMSEHGHGQHGAVPLNKGQGEVVRMDEIAGPQGCGEVSPTQTRVSAAWSKVQPGCRTQKCEDGGQGGQMGAMEDRTLKHTI